MKSLSKMYTYYYGVMTNMKTVIIDVVFYLNLVAINSAHKML
jgi:hypothetical protein